MIKISSKLIIRFLTLIYVISASLLSDVPYADAARKPAPKLRKQQMPEIAKAVRSAIRKRQIPGAVVLVGTPGKVLYRRAFGFRALKPEKLPMTADTIFDISSLTKVVATTTAVMQLAEQGKLLLEDRVSNYWPEFRGNEKEQITVRDLLTHYSGLRPDLDIDQEWTGYDAALKKVLDEKPVYPPGTHFIYSDINFEILGELVHRISGHTLDKYCSEHIFGPLGMENTFFNPPSSLLRRIAPTERVSKKKMLWGKVHDPSASRMGGVAGHAGLFSTADDLSVFADMIMGGGLFNSKRILDQTTVEKMTTPQNPPVSPILRGLGWDIDSPFSSCRGSLFPVGSFGHTGYTGTSIWIDPASKTYVIILTNRVHPNGKGNAVKLRSSIATIVAKAVRANVVKNILPVARPSSGMLPPTVPDYRHTAKVLTGIDVLKSENFRTLAGKRIGLITNHSGLESGGQRTLDLLYKAPGVKLSAIFSPEHGLSGKLDKKIDSGTDPHTGLPVYSLYGKVKRPTEKMLDGLDALVFDIQDAGTRFYTYISTMGYAMEAAAKKKIPFYVLDRPNPITSSFVQGPVMDKDLKSFTGYFSLPVRHGMTVGELAAMFNDVNGIGADLHVVGMRGYERSKWFDDTGLPWVNPSPNIRSLNEAVLYPGVAMVEGANVSVGRGTDRPFELVGAPWVNSKELADYLTGRGINGVKFLPADFTPAGDNFAKKECQGVRVELTDRQALDPAVLGIEIASALYKLYPRNFELDKTLSLVGSREVLKAIRDGKDPSAIASQWQEGLEQFKKLRAKYLLY